MTKVERSPPNLEGLARWYALWTRSNSEQVVEDQLAAKGFRTFLPTLRVWSRRGRLPRKIEVPMFPGYLFMRHAFDKNSYVEVLKTRGLVSILGGAWERLTPVSDVEIESIQRVVESGLRVSRHEHLREGQRVRITGGALAGVEGFLVRRRPEKGLLVLSVNLLHRSVAVEIPYEFVEPV